MDIIPPDVHGRFMLIHLLVLCAWTGAICTAVVARQACTSFERARNVVIFLLAYLGAGILYLIILQTPAYGEFQHNHPLLSWVFRAPAAAYGAVDTVIGKHAGGTALHALVNK